MKWPESKLLAGILLLAIFLVSCQPNTTDLLLSEAATEIPTQTDAERTFSSLKRLSLTAALYEMHYIGDYGFDQRILQDQQLAKQSTIPVYDFACSCFAALGDPDQRFFGRNFDWYDHPALVLFTDPPNGFASLAMVDLFYLGYGEQREPLDDPQDLLQAPYLPFDGLNEQGLAVGMMAVPHAEGGVDPQKTTLDELELIRLLLDYASDVPHALALMDSYNVDFGSVPVHYLLADGSGNSAVVEYLDGKPVVLKGEQPWQVATNFLLAEEQPQGATASCPRYNRLYTGLQEQKGRITEHEGMELLQSVAQGGAYATRWSWIFDLTERKAMLVFGRNYQEVYTFELDR